MRCLALADALREFGAECAFVCRAHRGNLLDHIERQGFEAFALPLPNPGRPLVNEGGDIGRSAYANWLGVHWAIDAEQTGAALRGEVADWLVVDHYALDAEWEQALIPRCDRLMVIDDLADRAHSCNLLLDQTFQRRSEDYRPWVPPRCQTLCGSQYALLRPEFAALRAYSLQRRGKAVVKELLINMGGVDKHNVTEQMLDALSRSALPRDCRIKIVMGAAAPWLDEVRAKAESLPWPAIVLVGVNNMAQLMADSDLVIGAAGTGAWERCCLGLPTITMVLAENQRLIARTLHDAGAVFVKDLESIKHEALVTADMLELTRLSAMSAVAALVTDGAGTWRVVNTMTQAD